MNLFIFNGLLLLGLSVIITSEVFAAGEKWSQSMLLMNPEMPLKKCQHFRDKTRLVCNCKGLNMESIPLSLDSNIEILDFSFNRLVNINKDTFSKFTSLQFLDLQDNFLRKIEGGAFDPLQDLTVLDLTKTILETLPTGLLNLPHLEKLYLENNQLTDEIFQTKVTSPLRIIHVATNSFRKFPDLGPFSTLEYLNVSNNHISKLSVEDISPYCKLMTLDVSNNPISFDPATCDCHNFNAWIKKHKITVRPNFSCSSNSGLSCSGKFSNRTMSLYHECEEIIKEKIETEKAKSTWTLVLSCVAGSLICIFFILYCIHRRNKKRHRKLKKAQQLASSNANTELLNSNMQEQS